jgi:hypothetical protein
VSGERFAHTKNRVLHRVTERPYPRIDWEIHAGDTDCGLEADNGYAWCWCDGSERYTLRRCFFCFEASA